MELVLHLRNVKHQILWDLESTSHPCLLKQYSNITANGKTSYKNSQKFTLLLVCSLAIDIKNGKLPSKITFHPLGMVYPA